MTFHGIHAFRHAFATSAITSGKVDIKTISAILGHTQTSTTLNIYAHEIAKANATAIDTIEDIIHSKLDREKQPRRFGIFVVIKGCCIKIGDFLIEFAFG